MSGELGQCIGCGSWKLLNGNGTVRKHQRWSAWQRGYHYVQNQTCSGSGQRPRRSTGTGRTK